MEKEKVFEKADKPIDLEKVVAFEDAEGSKKPKLQVHLSNGSIASVEGKEDVQEFVEAIDEHLDAEDK